MSKTRILKPERYRQLPEFPNVFEPPIAGLLQVPFERCGQWNTSFFNRSAPLILEMGCGWGDFALELARMSPEKNVLGLDVKGGRIWRGARTALNEGLKNVGFIRVEGEGLDRLFAPGELNELWITFPTPWLRKPEKMLISPTFLARYRTILAADGILHLKTDVTAMADYAENVWPHCGFRIIDSHDLDGEKRTAPEFSHAAIGSDFEARALRQEKTIRYIQAVPEPGVVPPLPEAIRLCPWSPTGDHKGT